MDGMQWNEDTVPFDHDGMVASTGAGVRARLWANQAANGLYRRRPCESARQAWPAWGQAAALGLAPVWCLMLIAAPAPTTLVTLAIASPVFLALTVLRLCASILSPRWAQHLAVPDMALPRATILVALHDEATVLPDLHAALQTIDYPADRLEIMLVLEAHDTITRRAAAALPPDPRLQVVIVPPGSPRTKPRALNYALRYCTGEIVVIHDAEDRPHPRQLRTAAESFMAGEPRLACLQAPLNWYNRDECWLTRQFALEYAAQFHALLPLYHRLGWPLPLGGTSNYFKTGILRAIGGWDAWNVTEDADLGLRLYRAGYRSALIEPPTMEEAPITLRAWICQRTRWIKGHAQTVGVHARQGASAHPSRIALGLTLGAAIASALLHLPLIVLGLAALVVSDAPPLFLPLFACGLASGYIAAMLCAATGMRRAGLTARWSDIVTMPAYWVLQAPAAVRALYQLVRTPYVWEKTQHGVSAMTGGAATGESAGSA